MTEAVDLVKRLREDYPGKVLEQEDEIREIAGRWQAGDGSGHTAYTISEIQRALAQPHTQGEKNHG